MSPDSTDTTEPSAEATDAAGTPMEAADTTATSTEAAEATATSTEAADTAGTSAEAAETTAVWPFDEPVQAAWPENVCFGCGPANEAGLGLESYLAGDGETLVATFEPAPAHTAGYADFMYGGLLACVVDCHSLWAAMTAAYRAEGRPLLSEPLRMYVTGDLSVEYREPTPMDGPLRLEATAIGPVGKTVDVRCEVRSGDRLTVRGNQTAVRMRDPPALDEAGCHERPL